ncbi:MAG: zinc-binding CMP/dCMP deaminase [candidate division TM6 bacterium GW2011_GWF2_30_66]|jgi:tRNA(Arg) A34 adenosine deaminase TadA|nr:MAG: zinc-binding CMP/dCMP deaminase [candidate division TM6 bacterium GW2011_GWF2_30_66]
MPETNKFMARAIELSIENIKNKTGGPFGAVIVKDNIIIAQGANSVTKNNDPTAHAEIVAIRNACKNLNTFNLSDCVIYTSCEPCPMCLSAIYWSRINTIYYGNTKSDAANINFDDAFIYEQMAKPYDQRTVKMINIMHQESLEAFKLWEKDTKKIEY